MENGRRANPDACGRLKSARWRTLEPVTAYGLATLIAAAAALG